MHGSSLFSFSLNSAAAIGITIASLAQAAARARGRRGGRPKFSPNARKVALARALYADEANTIPEICNTLKISRATLYRYLGKSGSK